VQTGTHDEEYNKDEDEELWRSEKEAIYTHKS
jgi:hypothetical protein